MRACAGLLRPPASARQVSAPWTRRRYKWRKGPGFYLSDALEAVIGALYLDGGYEVARTFVLQYVLNDLENKELFHDSKTALQEMVQSKVKDTVTYQLLEAQGPEHNRSFVVQAMVGDIKLCTGRGRTKQSAGQDAAYKSIIMLKENPGLIKES